MFVPNQILEPRGNACVDHCTARVVNLVGVSYFSLSFGIF